MGPFHSFGNNHQKEKKKNTIWDHLMFLEAVEKVIWVSRRACNDSEAKYFLRLDNRLIDCDLYEKEDLKITMSPSITKEERSKA